MELFVLIPFALAILYSLFIYLWNKNVNWRLSLKHSIRIKYIHYFLLLITIILVVIYIKTGIQLRGMWTNRIVLILNVLSGVFLIFVLNKSAINKFEKFYFKMFSFLPQITVSILLIPFLGVVIIFSLIGRLITPAEIIYSDNNIRIQNTFKGVLGPPHSEIFQKNFIFEKFSYELPFGYYEIDSVDVKCNKDSVKLTLFAEKHNDTTIKINLPKF